MNKNKAIISLWEVGFNGLENGRKLEAIVAASDVKDYIDCLHYPERAVIVEDTTLPITETKNPDYPDDPRLFRKVG